MTNYDLQMERLESYFLPEHIKLTDAEVLEIETVLGATLPIEYGRFLKEFGLSAFKGNVMYPDPENIAAAGGGVEVFYGWKSEKFDLLRNWRGMIGRIPPEYLPIAESPGGLICICFKGINLGKVFWWDREEPEENAEDNLTPISANFDSFIGSLVLANTRKSGLAAPPFLFSSENNRFDEVMVEFGATPGPQYKKMVHPTNAYCAS